MFTAACRTDYPRYLLLAVTAMVCTAAQLLTPLVTLAADEPKPAATSEVPRSTAASWPLYRGDATASGVAVSTLPEKLEQLWKFEVDGGAFEATPSIVDGTVYLGDLDGTMYALELATGKKVWQKTFEETGFIASPAVRGDLLFVGDVNGKCYAIDRKTGEPKWTFDTEGEIDSSANFYRDYVLFGSQDRFLYCLETATGKLVWKFGIEDQIRCTPTVVGDRAFLAGCDSKLHIVNLEKGTAEADVPIDAPTGVTPAVFGDQVFFGTEAGVFFGVNWKTAKVAWKVVDESSSQPYRSSPAVTASTVIVGSRNRRVQAFDPATGNEQWSFATKQRIDSSPVIVGERVFVGAADGRLYALDVKSGKEIWQTQVTGGFTGSPAIADEKLVIATDRGTIFCYGKK